MQEAQRLCQEANELVAIFIAGVRRLRLPQMVFALTIAVLVSLVFTFKFLV
jgi:hypothetical protein